MPFAYPRTIHFPDTDAAGVVFFANYFVICHEAYEEALRAAGIELKEFFKDTGVIIPIAKSEAEYLRPLACGDQLSVSVKPALLSENSFEVRYELTRVDGKTVARVRTEHVCTSRKQPGRVPLPPAITAWVKAG